MADLEIPKLISLRFISGDPQYNHGDTVLIGAFEDGTSFWPTFNMVGSVTDFPAATAWMLIMTKLENKVSFMELMWLQRKEYDESRKTT